MLEKISNTIVNLLIEKKSVKKENKAIYLYGTMLLLSTLAGLISIIAISLLLFDLATVLVFFAFFIPLRVHAGGYHCKHFFSCFIVSNILFVVIVLVAKAFSNNAYFSTYSSILFSFLTLIIVVAFSPVTNANNPLSPAKKKNNRKKAIIYATIYLIFIIIFNCLKFDYLDYYICVASSSESSIVVLMIMEIIMERSTKKCLNS